MTPIYELSLGNDAIQNRLEKLEIKDFAESRGDTLSIKLNGKGIQKPRLGVDISIKIGYAETNIWDAGTFIVQEVGRTEDARRRGRANVLTIRGISQPQGEDASASLQTTSKERIFQDKTFDDVATEIITSIGLTPKIDSSLRNLMIPVTLQRNETDAELLDRLAQERDAFVKYHDKQVIIQPYDAEPIGQITLNRSQITGYHFLETQYSSIGKVTAKYTDMAAGKTKRYTAGTGRGTVIDTTFPDQLTAEHAAKAKLKMYQRAVQTVTVQLPTQPGMFAEKTIELTGFDDAELNQKYNTRAVCTTLDRRGLRSILQLESIPS